jgi:transcriptional antiterminator RfaH
MDESLFPRYLFIRLGQGESAPSWELMRFTKGVSRLVSFGVEPAKVADSLVDALRTQEASVQAEPERLFKPGERVRLTEALCRHRRHLPNGRWRAPRQGVDRTAF